MGRCLRACFANGKGVAKGKKVLVVKYGAVEVDAVKVCPNRYLAITLRSLLKNKNMVGMELSQIIGESAGDEIRFENKMDIVRLSQKGLTMRRLQKLQDYFKLSVNEIARILHLSEKQLARYSPDHVLPVDISARVLQIAEVYSRGMEVFEELDSFNRWLRRPIMALGFAVPLDLLATPQGVEIVLDEIGRIEHGLVA